MRHRVFIILAASTLFFSCNVFDPFDSPTNEAQLLSAARACLDQGDVTCAKENYAKLASTSSSDVAEAETAFAILEENGVTMEAFMGALGDFKGNIGTILNNLTERVKSQAGSGFRQNIFDAYKRTASIKNNNQLRGLVRLITALTFAAATFAEITGANGKLYKTDIVTGGSVCTSDCDNANCNISSKINMGTQKNFLASDLSSTDITGSVTIGMIDGAIEAVYHALTSEIGASGNVQSGMGNSSEQIKNATFSGTNNDTAARCYRATLLAAGIGN